MGRACRCWPPLSGARPQWHCTHGAARCVLLGPLRAHCTGQVYPCIPLAPLTPVLAVTGDNFGLLVFLPCTHRACGSSPIPNPAALHLRGTQSSKISAARGGSKPSQLHRRLTTNERTSPLLPTHPCYPPFDTVACRSLALFPPFASSFSSSNTPPRNHQTCGPAGDGTDLKSPNTACLACTAPATTTTTLLYADPRLRAEVCRPITNRHSDDRGCWALRRHAGKERWKGKTEARVAEAWCRASCCW